MPEITEQRAQRLALLERVEELAGARVLVYFTADSPIAGGQISEDAALPILDHLRSIGRQKRLALYLYSPGGVLETPWKIITMLREFCEELYAIVPYKAHSAATMIAMGTDKIYMTKKSELGPIDPALTVPAPTEGPIPALQQLGVEDIAAYVTFMRDRAKLTDQAAMANVIGTLAQYLTPPLLGRIERTYSHIRLVARNLLSLHKPPLDDRQISAIIEALTEKIYTHGHGIGRNEASQIGLDVRSLLDEEENPVWELYQLYEGVFRLRDSRDVESYIKRDADLYEQPDTSVACVESADLLHAFTGTVRAERIRKIPPNPNISINLQLNIPAGIQANQLPQGIQQAIQQIMQQGAQQLSNLVAEQLRMQSPVVGLTAKIVGGKWARLA